MNLKLQNNLIVYPYLNHENNLDTTEVFLGASVLFWSVKLESLSRLFLSVGLAEAPDHILLNSSILSKWSISYG